MNLFSELRDSALNFGPKDGLLERTLAGLVVFLDSICCNSSKLESDESREAEGFDDRQSDFLFLSEGVSQLQLLVPSSEGSLDVLKEDGVLDLDQLSFSADEYSACSEAHFLAQSVHSIVMTWTISKYIRLYSYLFPLSSHANVLPLLLNLHANQHSGVVMPLLCAFLERILGDIWSCISDQNKTSEKVNVVCPRMMKDLLASHHLVQWLGTTLTRILFALVGSPRALNLRNLVWHGFLGHSTPENRKHILGSFCSLMIVLLFTILKKSIPILSDRSSSFLHQKTPTPSPSPSITLHSRRQSIETPTPFQLSASSTDAFRYTDSPLSPTRRSTHLRSLKSKYLSDSPFLSYLHSPFFIDICNSFGAQNSLSEFGDKVPKLSMNELDQENNGDHFKDYRPVVRKIILSPIIKVSSPQTNQGHDQPKLIKSRMEEAEHDSKRRNSIDMTHQARYCVLPLCLFHPAHDAYKNENEFMKYLELMHRSCVVAINSCLFSQPIIMGPSWKRDALLACDFYFECIRLYHVLHQEGIKSVLLRSSFLNESFRYTGNDVDGHSSFLFHIHLFLSILFPIIEHTLRYCFVALHCDKIPLSMLCARSNVLYTTLGIMLQPHVASQQLRENFSIDLEDAFYSESYGENPSMPNISKQGSFSSNRLLTFLGKNFSFLLDDIFLVRDGLRFRDRIAHGETSFSLHATPLPFVSLVFVCFISICHMFTKPFNELHYESNLMKDRQNPSATNDHQGCFELNSNEKSSLGSTCLEFSRSYVSFFSPPAVLAQSLVSAIHSVHLFLWYVKHQATEDGESDSNLREDKQPIGEAISPSSSSRSWNMNCENITPNPLDITSKVIDRIGTSSVLNRNSSLAPFSGSPIPEYLCSSDPKKTLNAADSFRDSKFSASVSTSLDQLKGLLHTIEFQSLSCDFETPVLGSLGDNPIQMDNNNINTKTTSGTTQFSVFLRGWLLLCEDIMRSSNHRAIAVTSASAYTSDSDPSILNKNDKNIPSFEQISLSETLKSRSSDDVRFVPSPMERISWHTIFPVSTFHTSLSSSSPSPPPPPSMIQRDTPSITPSVTPMPTSCDSSNKSTASKKNCNPSPSDNSVNLNTALVRGLALLRTLCHEFARVDDSFVQLREQRRASSVKRRQHDQLRAHLESDVVVRICTCVTCFYVIALRRMHVSSNANSSCAWTRVSQGVMRSCTLFEQSLSQVRTTQFGGACERLDQATSILVAHCGSVS